MVLAYNSNTNGKRLVKVGNKVIGTLSDNKFIKHVKGSKHILRHPPAIAIDTGAFDIEIRPNATEIIVIDTETSHEYYCSTDTFTRHYFKFNRGYGEQYACPINYFKEKGNGHHQLSLWGGDGLNA